MKKIIITSTVLLFAFVSFGQPDKGNPNNAPTPFGFVELLIGAGALYGGKKVYDAKKKDAEK